MHTTARHVLLLAVLLATLALAADTATATDATTQIVDCYTSPGGSTTICY